MNTTTKDLLNEVPKLFSSVALSAHEKRLEKVLGSVIERRGARSDEELAWLEVVEKAGFHSVVTTDWALRFKYHASVTMLTVCESDGIGDYPKQIWYDYKGDIPEFALDALEAFKKVSGHGTRVHPYEQRNADVTVHSMKPLPIKKTITLLRVDPVMIGWSDNPLFTLTNSRWLPRRNRLGVIIAVWDGFKEVEDYRVNVKDFALQ